MVNQHEIKFYPISSCIIIIILHEDILGFKPDFLIMKKKGSHTLQLKLQKKELQFTLIMNMQRKNYHQLKLYKKVLFRMNLKLLSEILSEF